MMGNLLGSSHRSVIGRFATLAVVAAGCLSGGLSFSPAMAESVPVKEVPSFYVGLRVVSREGLSVPRTDAVVRATATGAVVAVVAVPRPYSTFAAVSGEAGDRAFVLAAERLGGRGLSVQATGFFLLRINPAAAMASERAALTALPVPVQPKGVDLDGMAVSPDGSKLAVISTSWVTPGFVHARLHVFDMSTGAGRTWQGEALSGPGADAEGLSWAANSTTLQLIGRQTLSGWNKILLIDVARPGGTLADSRAIKVPGARAGSWRGAVISGNGRTVAVVLQGLRYRGHRVGEQLAKIGVRSGKVTAIVNTRRVTAAYEQVPWASRTGATLIVIGAGPRNRGAGIYVGQHYTPIPWPANLTTAAW